MPRYVLTGGLGTGKTSLIAILDREMTTVREPARAVIAEHRVLTGEPTLDHRPELFVERLISRSIEDYRSVPASATAIFDRAVPDCIAYAEVSGIEPAAAIGAAESHRYASPVFVAAPWKEIYRNDDMRRATFAQAEAFYEAVVSAYRRLSYELIELPQMPVEERAAWIIAHLP